MSENIFSAGRVVRDTPDFQRIQALPRRTWTPEQVARVQSALTARFKTPGGTQTLLPVQAMALAEILQYRGLFGSIGVGHGKSLISFLAPAILGAKRSLLFVKAALREKTQKDLREYREHWQIPNVALVTYEMLSNANFAGTLENVNPDLIIADEVHALKSNKAARTRRFLRYMKGAPKCMFIALSGTIARNSLRDYWALIALALRHNSPLPIPWVEIQDWADALDANVAEHRRVSPGVLVDMCPPSLVKADMTPLTQARTGYQNRFRVTPGVIATTTGSCDASLELMRRAIEVPPAVKEALSTLRNTWEAPNGDLIEWAIELWRYAREIASGFYSVWDPEAPRPWYDARRTWHRFVRDVLKTNTPGLDSPLQVARAFKDDPEYKDWVAVRDSFRPVSKPIWIDDYVARDAAQWLKDEQGIVWVEHPCVGEAIAGLSGYPYYGAGPDHAARIVHENGPFIASIAAHGTGKNLQIHNRNLVTSCIPSGSTWEQLLGRTHRTGQKADEVIAEVYQQCPEMEDSWDKAMREAEFVKQVHGEAQKLLYADKVGL